MIHLKRAVNEIANLKQEVQDKAFRNASIGPDSHLSFIQSVGMVQGLDMALDIILNITKGEDERE